MMDSVIPVIDLLFSLGLVFFVLQELIKELTFSGKRKLG
tara:strand:- start:1194 stop:1310 length:117 start_codon:yes stop_codon:yes gene_type:complete